MCKQWSSPMALPCGTGILRKGNARLMSTDHLDLPQAQLPRGSPAPRKNAAAPQQKTVCEKKLWDAYLTLGRLI